MLEEKTNLRSKDIKGTEAYGKRPATMNQTHQVIGTCAAHISWNLRSRVSEVERELGLALLRTGKMGFTHWDWDLATGNGMNNYKMGMGFLFFSGLCSNILK